MNIFGMSDSKKDVTLITPWSFIHSYSGFIFYLTLKYLYPEFSLLKIFILLIIVHTIYEIKDLLSYFNIKVSSEKWSDNSYMNSIFDTIFALIGFFVAYYVNNNSKNFYFINIVLYFYFIYYFINSGIG